MKTTRKLTERQRELLGLFSLEGDRWVYQQDKLIDDWATVKKVFVTLGATWRRASSTKPGGFVFEPDVDSLSIVEAARATGEIVDPKKAGFFPTPDALADIVVKLADGKESLSWLEPSAGNGQLVRAIFRFDPEAFVKAYELLPENAKVLRCEVRLDVIEGNFLQLGPPPGGRLFDRVVMNPPFASQADQHHVSHAFRWLAPGGRLVAIMSEGTRWRTNAQSVAFRAWVKELGGVFHDVDDGAFKESGTMVRTCILVLNKGK